MLSKFILLCEAVKYEATFFDATTVPIITIMDLFFL